MYDDAVWQAFRETGDPLCYLLYKAAETRKPQNKDDRKDQPGQLPRAEG